MVNELVHDLPAALDVEALSLVRDQAGYLHEAIMDVALDEGAVRLRLGQTLDEPAQASLRQALDRLIERTAKSFAKVSIKVLAEEPGRPTFDRDPMPLLRDTRQAVEAYRGTFTLRSDLLRVVTALDQFFRRYGLELGAEEQAYPTTVPLHSMVRNGYMGGFPHHALLVARIHSDLAAFTAVAEDRGGDAIPIDRLSGAEQMLAPTVCYHCFEAMRGQDVSEVGGLFTATALCHRHEGTAIEGLRRLQTFTMREIVFFGPADHVSGLKDRIIEHTRDCFARWGVGFELTTATDPFFPVSGESKRAFQALQALKHEMRIRLPFDGTTIACASFNSHKNTLVEVYGITGADSARLESGCVGYGFERMAYGLFAQFGMEVGAWPAPIRDDLGLAFVGPGPSLHSAT